MLSWAVAGSREQVALATKAPRLQPTAEAICLTTVWPCLHRPLRKATPQTCPTAAMPEANIIKNKGPPDPLPLKLDSCWCTPLQLASDWDCLGLGCCPPPRQHPCQRAVELHQPPQPQRQPWRGCNLQATMLSPSCLYVLHGADVGNVPNSYMPTVCSSSIYKTLVADGGHLPSMTPNLL